MKLDLDLTKAQLFSETPGRFIVTAAPENAAAFEKILGDDAVKSVSSHPNMRLRQSLLTESLMFLPMKHKRFGRKHYRAL